ncbi:hypothetical protein [Pseudomonas sp. LT1P18]|uniref:hypothetical protein n=1 Tax=Pseudomonas arabinosi TaxID=3398357 RepID=UPI0039EEBA18
MPFSSDPEEESLEPPVHYQFHRKVDTEPDADTIGPWQAVAAPEQQSDSSLVRVFIKSKACASELYVVNRAYALVAKGVGIVDAHLEPGRYKVRQRIGYSELVHDLEIPDAQGDLDVELPALDFPSPIPLAGTSLVSNLMVRPFSLGAGNFRFILRTPIEAGSSLTTTYVEHMRNEMRRFRLESFDGELSIPFGDAQPIGEEQSALVFDTDLSPGMYVVVQQQHDQRQVCLPVLVLKNRVTAVFSLALNDGTVPVPVQLDHAAVAMLREDEQDLPYEGSLLRLEAARKAIGAGRHVYGWDHPAVDPGSSENILLALLDLQLGWRCMNPLVTDQGASPPSDERPLMHVDVARLLDQLELVRSVLGQGNADLVALIFAMKVEVAEKEILPLKGPPLLRRSWDQLLSTHEGNALAANLMTFPFQTEPSPTWFLWSEKPGVRASALAEGRRRVQAGSDGPTFSFPISDSGVLGSVLTSAMNITLPLKGTFALGLNVVKNLIHRVPWLTKSLDTAHPSTVTFDDVEAMLAALIRNKSFVDWLNKAQLVFQAEDETITDESMRRLVSSLHALSDPKLVEMLGPDVIARQVLATLRLPQSRVVQLVEELLKGVVNRLSDSDRTAILAVLQGAVAAAEVWLTTKTPPKNS